MTLLLLAPAVLSALVLGAHLVREGMFVLLPPLFLALALLLVPRGWVARLWQFLLMLAALEWVRTAVFLVQEREQDGRPWTRMAVVLGGMALLSVASALLFETSRLQRLYPRHTLW